MKGAIVFFGVYFLALTSFGQEKVPSKLFALKPDRVIDNFLLLDTIEQIKPKENYHLILSHNKWYAVGDGDGQVFTPENNSWKRIDKTRLEGYHYGAFLFDCNGALIKYGGYGFWRSHGMFVRFNENTGDWQIQPADRDLPFNGELAYFHKKSNCLYTFGNHIYNQSTNSEKTFIDSLFRIDLLKMKWENLGKLNDDLINRYHLQNRLMSLSHNNGCFVLPISSDSTAIYFNFEDLTFNIYNPENNPQLFSFFQELPKNKTLYSDNFGLKILNNDSIQTLDSLSWQMATANPVVSGRITNSKESFNLTQKILTAVSIGIIALLAVFYIFIKRKQTRNKNITEEEVPNAVIDLSITNTIKFNGALFPIDAIDYAIIRMFIQQDASTLELNEWLGLENKQPENQKKQRAEWIKKMNSFFNSIGFKDDAFNRERLETDKRMFMYKMNNLLKPNDASSDFDKKK